jgi:hypothetical protein
MYRTDAPNNNAGQFQDQDPQTGTPGTVVDAPWLNAVQEELAYLIEQQGIVLAKGNSTQVRLAVQKMITDAQKRIQLDQPTFASGVADGDIVYWDDVNARFDKAIADSTNKDRAVGAADVSNGKVIAFGEAAVFAGLTPGARCYLSDAVAGAITTVAPLDRIEVGIAKSATTLYVDIDLTGAGLAKGMDALTAGSGTYNPPGPGLLVVRMWGGGGGGGRGWRSGGTSGSSGGGGGEGAAERTVVVATDGSGIAYSVGAGGASVTDGSPTTFGGFTVNGGKAGATASAIGTGGSGGSYGTQEGPSQGPGGTGANGSAAGANGGVNQIGFTGGTGGAASGGGYSGGGGGGGAGPAGNGADGGAGVTLSPGGIDGAAALANSGAGGGGGGGSVNGAQSNGGQGGSGKIEVYYLTF